MVETYGEQELLGAVLVDSRCMVDFQSVNINAEDFAIEHDSSIWQAVSELRRQGKAIDPVTVLDKLKELELYAEDMREYILQLMEITPTASNALIYAKRVKQSALDRKLEELVSDNSMDSKVRMDKIRELTEQSAQLDKIGGKFSDVHAVSASTITREDTPMVRMFIDEFLPQGLLMLNGFSKAGKSRLLLQMMLALSEGKPFLGRSTEKCDCLYLALEDEKIDYNNRLLAFCEDKQPPQGLYTILKSDFPNYETPTLDDDGGLIELIENELKLHPEIGVIGIDVFSAIRSQATKHFQDDERRDINKLLCLSAKHGIAIVVAHHVGKIDMRNTAKRNSSIGSGAGSYAVSGTVIGEYELSSDPDDERMRVLRYGSRRTARGALQLLDNYPFFEFVGNYDEITGAQAEEKAQRDLNALVSTIKYIYEVYCANGKSWDGNAQALLAKNREKLELPQMVSAPNKRSFTDAVLRRVHELGIDVRQIKHGNASPTYRVEQFNSMYEQDTM